VNQGALALESELAAHSGGMAALYMVTKRPAEAEPLLKKLRGCRKTTLRGLRDVLLTYNRVPEGEKRSRGDLAPQPEA